MNKRLLAFSWYGGKFSHLNWLLPLLPQTKCFCEPYGGSAAVLINREPSKIEVFNDIDSNVITFFKVLREQPDELIRLISLTPYSREEYENAFSNQEALSELERARRFFVKARQSRDALAVITGKAVWSKYKNFSRRGMALNVSRWLGAIEKLPLIAERLLRVQFESQDALKILKYYDSPDTLFYCDPPYPQESRKAKDVYFKEYSNKEYEILEVLLSSLEGLVAISSYHCPFIDELFKGWFISKEKPKIAWSSRSLRQEILFTNYKVKGAKISD